MSRHDLGVALDAAADYLDGVRRDDHLWHGFPTLAGRSDHWVSGFVATHLADSGLAVDLEPTVAALLARQASDGGWGFGGPVPADADSTAWCLSAVAASAPSDDVARARAALQAHRVGDGFATYRGDSGIVEFVGRSPEGAAGWLHAHPDVTAAVLLAGVPERGSPDEDAVLRHLLGESNATGLIPSYWWRGMLYASTLTLRALRTRGRRSTATWEDAAAEGLAGLQRPDGGYALGAEPSSAAFLTALGLEAWCHLGYLDPGDRRDRAAEALLRMQRDDGGWPGDFVLRIPSPAVTEPRLVPRWDRGTGGGNSFVPDVDGLFATSAAVYALNLWAAGPREADGGAVVVEPAEPAANLHEVLVTRPAAD